MGATAGIAQGASAATGAYSQSIAYRAQADFQEARYKQNAKLAEAQAEEAVRIGDLESGKVKRKGEAVKSAQRVALAAQGLDTTSGSAADVQDNTDNLVAEDIATIKSNAWRTAFGFKTQANDYTQSAAFSSIAGDLNARSTLLTGGLNAIGKFGEAGYELSKRSPTVPTYTAIPTTNRQASGKDPF